jgi:DNA (cytosine-5)-methyltransferase 1
MVRCPVTRPRLLDLYCGAGGAAVGYHRAGFNVTGVDTAPQPRYPFEFHLGDAMTWPLDGYAAIHASPPCQDHIRGGSHPVHGTGWMLAATRDRLTAQSVPWIIENVPGAPMRADYRLCGCMFGLTLPGMRLERVRWFETSWHGFDMRPPCYQADPAVSVVGHGTTIYARRKLGRNPTILEYRALMGIGWTTHDELSQAIPPAYTEYLGRQLLEVVTGAQPGRWLT